MSDWQGTGTLIVDSPLGNYYAINDGAFVSTTDADIEDSCKDITFHVKSVLLNKDHTDVTPNNSTQSIHWMDIRDILLPDANNFVDDALRLVYYTPLKMTEAGGTNYSRHIVQIASLYIAWRIESRDYPGAGMPTQSEYSDTLKAMMNERINELLIGSVRLRGQRLKSKNRFINPRIEEQYIPVKDEWKQTTMTPPATQ